VSRCWSNRRFLKANTAEPADKVDRPGITAFRGILVTHLGRADLVRIEEDAYWE